MPGPTARDDDALVGRGGGEDDAVLVELVFRQGGDAVRKGEGGRQRRQREHAGQRVRPEAAQFVPEQPQRPGAHGGVHQAEEQPGADHAQLRHQQQRKGHRHRQRTEVVEGQHLRDQVLEHDVAPQDAHDQRDLEPHQRADHHHQAVQQQAEGPGHVGVGDEQQRRQEAADERDHQLDAQEVRGQLALEVARQPRAHAHGEEVGADDGAELQHRVAEQVGAQRGRAQLVDQPAGRDHEDAGEQGDGDGGGAAAANGYGGQRGRLDRRRVGFVHGKEPRPFGPSLSEPWRGASTGPA